MSSRMKMNKSRRIENVCRDQRIRSALIEGLDHKRFNAFQLTYGCLKDAQPLTMRSFACSFGPEVAQLSKQRKTLPPCGQDGLEQWLWRKADLPISNSLADLSCGCEDTKNIFHKPILDRYFLNNNAIRVSDISNKRPNIQMQFTA